MNCTILLVVHYFYVLKIYLMGKDSKLITKIYHKLHFIIKLIMISKKALTNDESLYCITFI